MRTRNTAKRTAPQEGEPQPDRSRRAVLTGGAVGLAAVAGAAFVDAAPASAATAPTWLAPSGDTSGATDTRNIQNALDAGGLVGLGQGDFYVAGDPAITVPAQSPVCSIVGLKAATNVHLVGSGTAFFVHRTSGYGAQFGLPAQQTTVYLRDFVVDGTHVTGGAGIGVDIGDGWGYDLDLTIVNFSTPGSIALNIVNRVFWTEKGRFRAQLMNNATAAVLDTAVPAKDHSHEYNFYDFNIFCNEDQQGVVVANGVNNGGCVLWLHGNMSLTSSTGGTPTGNVAALTVTGDDGSGDGSGFLASEIVMKVEGNRGIGQGTTYPYGILFGSGENSIKDCHGLIAHSLSTSNLNGGEFSFRGRISGDAGLALIYPGAPGSGQTSSSPPAVPASGTALQNYGPDQTVYVSGGTVSGIAVNTVPTGKTSGTFFVPAGGVITLTYTAAPSWTWVPAAYSPN